MVPRIFRSAYQTLERGRVLRACSCAYGELAGPAVSLTVITSSYFPRTYARNPHATATQGTCHGHGRDLYKVEAFVADFQTLDVRYFERETIPVLENNIATDIFQF